MRNIVVVDSSIAIKWVLEESDSDIAQKLLDTWIDQEKIILAPILLAYEVTNALYKNVRKSEITLPRAKEALADFFEAEITFDASPGHTLGPQTLELAHRFNLPATYDAYFLALAERERCELWTADARMWNAVKGKLNWVHNLSEHQPDSSF